MRILGNYWLVTGVVAGLLACGGLSACGDGDTTGDPADVPLFDTGNFPDTQTPDTSAPDVDTVVPDTQIADVDTTAPDLVPDLEPPTIISTSPADGATNVALPLTVTITFSEPVYGPTIASQSVKLIDFAGDDVPGTPVLSADGLTVTWTPTTDDQQPASPYTIQVINVVKDLAGNTLEGTQEYTFGTANYADQGEYRVVAETYAPNIYSSVITAAQAQIPTKFDADGDWNLDNNRAWLTQTATSIVPAVYYNVAETPSHYFIHYYLYFPWVNDPATGYGHANGAVAYMVTVEKERAGGQAERPISVHTFYKYGNVEVNFAHVTSESGIFGTGSNDWWLDKVWSQADLFPTERFDALVTAQTHRACLWSWNQGGTLPQCDLTDVDMDKTLLFTYEGGAPTPVQKGEAGWPTDMDDVDETESFGYALVPIVSSLWPRRFAKGTGAIYQLDEQSYSPQLDRPPAGGVTLTSKLRNGLASSSASTYGRAFWAMGWEPAGRAQVKRGQLALDPAWYVWRRHKSTVNPSGLTDFDADADTGFALDYCFNGMLNIDVRGVADGCP